MYSSKLYRKLPAEILPSETGFFRIATTALTKRIDLYHIQFEYRSFGGFAKSLATLVGLTMILSLRKPVVVTLHGIVTVEALGNRRLKRLIMLAYLVCYKITARFSRIIVHSDSMQRTLAETYRISNVTVIPHGTDPARRYPQTQSDLSKILFWGFVRPEKGVENLIISLKFVPNQQLSLIIAGDLARPAEARYLEYLRQIVSANQLEKQVNFITRFVADEEKCQHFSNALALVLPYTDKFVEVSGVAHDLAGSGIPLICSHTPRFDEFTDRYDCLKVSTSPEQIASAIIGLLRDTTLRETIVRNLMRRTISESWSRVAEKHFQLYRSMINQVTSSFWKSSGLNHEMKQSGGNQTALALDKD